MIDERNRDAKRGELVARNWRLLINGHEQYDRVIAIRAAGAKDGVDDALRTINGGERVNLHRRVQ